MERFIKYWIEENKQALTELGNLRNDNRILSMFGRCLEENLRKYESLKWAFYRFNKDTFEIHCSGYHNALFSYEYNTQTFCILNEYKAITIVLNALTSNSIEDIIKAIIKYNEDKTKETKQLWWMKKYFDKTDLDKIEVIHECSNPSHWAHGDNFFIFKYKGKVIHFESYDSGAYSGNHQNNLRCFRVIDEEKNGSYSYDSPTIKKINPNGVGLVMVGDNIVGGKIDLTLLEQEIN